MKIIKKELIKVTGIVRIIKKDIYGKIIGISNYKNIITTIGLQMICDAIIESADFTGITYFALGDDDTNPAIGDTLLGNETFRKQIAFRERTNQSIVLSSYLTTSEANGTYKELGHFGNDATITLESGDLFNHTEINETKTDDVTWTIEQTITFANV